jgi:hypothetical protein
MSSEGWGHEELISDKLDRLVVIGIGAYSDVTESDTPSSPGLLEGVA